MNDSKKINVAELLLNCPTGMELDCTMYDNCTFEGIENVGYINIKIKTPSGIIDLTKEGCYIRHDENAKCVIFPKGKTSWEGFVPPHQFKDGDIISDDFGSVCIFKGEGGIKGTVDFYCGIDDDANELYIKDVKDKDEHFGDIDDYQLASEEEKKKLFATIKSNGYKWDSETKTLEQLIVPKFKEGDRIAEIGGSKKGEIIYIDLDKYHVAVSNDIGIDVLFKDQDEWELVNDNFESKSISPKFKEGDRIVLKDNPYNMPSLKIKTVTNELYILEEGFFYITSTDERYVLENKFNINDLKPFDKVLVRYNSDSVWIAQLFEAYDKTQYWPIFCVGHTRYPQCIPYKNNEHLLGTTNECDEFYKTWED